MIEWYSQMVATSPDSTTNHLMAKEEVLLQHETTGKTGVIGLAERTVAGDLGADETNETILAYDIANYKGDVDEPVNREGHNVPTGVDQPGVEEVIGTAIARNTGYPPDMGKQIPPMTYSRSDTESGSDLEDSEPSPHMVGR